MHLSQAWDPAEGGLTECGGIFVRKNLSSLPGFCRLEVEPVEKLPETFRDVCNASLRRALLLELRPRDAGVTKSITTILEFFDRLRGGIYDARSGAMNRALLDAR